MKIAITGGTGFVGSHLARSLAADGHEVVLLARGTPRSHDIHRLQGGTFVAGDLSDPVALTQAFAGCDAVAHCAGINRELGTQTFERVHVEGTRQVLQAASGASVRKVVHLSFLRARPNCGSAYHESKWAAEELVRASGLDYTVIKAGMTYGRGDHMLDHLSHSFHTMPLLLTVGWRQQPVRPLAVEDLIKVLKAALIEGRLSRESVPVVGPEQLYLRDAARRVARLVGRWVLMMPAPIWFHYALAHVFERTMKIPLVALAQVRILSESGVEPVRVTSTLPADLMPTRAFTDEQIRVGLPAPGRFSLGDVRCCDFRA
jgi:NADH dehydrogenase